MQDVQRVLHPSLVPESGDWSRLCGEPDFRLRDFQYADVTTSHRDMQSDGALPLGDRREQPPRAAFRTFVLNATDNYQLKQEEVTL